jgi:hypothetical protein
MISKKIYLRPAIAMIELIFAIVIMGIVLSSAPMLISTASQSGYVSLQQEAIAAGATKVGLILTHHWDEGDTNSTLGYAPLLSTDTDAPSGLAGTNATVGPITLPTGRRAGTPNTPEARTFFSIPGAPIFATTPAAGLGPDVLTDPNGNDDVDDFIQVAIATLVAGGAATTNTTGDYVDRTMTTAIAVNYVNDAPTGAGETYLASNTITFNNPTTTAIVGGATTSSIKHIQITTADTGAVAELQKSIVLHAFSCNIGQYLLNKRTF